MSNIRELLLNANYNRLSLVNLLNEDLDNDESEAPVLFKHSPYYDNDNFIYILRD